MFIALLLIFSEIDPEAAPERSIFGASPVYWVGQTGLARLSAILNICYRHNLRPNQQAIDQNYEDPTVMDFEAVVVRFLVYVFSFYQSSITMVWSEVLQALKQEISSCSGN